MNLRPGLKTRSSLEASLCFVCVHSFKVFYHYILYRMSQLDPLSCAVRLRDMACVCSYCQNLKYAQQLEQPFVADQYRDYSCVLPISKAMLILLAEAVLYFLIALYLDNVLSNESGVRRRPWCALPTAWGGQLIWPHCSGW